MSTLKLICELRLGALSLVLSVALLNLARRSVCRGMESPAANCNVAATGSLQRITTMSEREKVSVRITGCELAMWPALMSEGEFVYSIARKISLRVVENGLVRLNWKMN